MSLTRKQIISILLLIASIIYDAIPVDFIPDIPIVGWLDDILVTSSAAVNCFQQFYEDGNPYAVRIMEWLKWSLIIIAVLLIIVIILLAGTIFSLLKG